MINKLLLSFLLCVLFFVTVHAGEQKLNFAVADFSAENVSQVEASIVGNCFCTGLVNTNMFNVLERKDMETILAEQKFQMSGCTEFGCAVKMGKLLNVNCVVLGSLSELGGTYYINARVVDVESGKVTCNQRISCSSQKDLPKKAEILAAMISESVSGKRANNYIFKEDKRFGIFFGYTSPLVYANAKTIAADPADFTLMNFREQSVSGQAYNPEIGFRLNFSDRLLGSVSMLFPPEKTNDNIYVDWQFSGLSGTNIFNRTIEYSMCYSASIEYSFLERKNIEIDGGVGAIFTSLTATFDSGGYYVYNGTGKDIYLLPGSKSYNEAIIIPNVFLSVNWKIYKNLNIMPLIRCNLAQPNDITTYFTSLSGVNLVPVTLVSAQIYPINASLYLQMNF